MTTQMNNYEDVLDHYSFSQLSCFSLDFIKYVSRYIHKKESETTKALYIGSAVDALIQSTDVFYDKFMVATAKEPTGKVGEALEIYCKLIKDGLDKDVALVEAHTQARCKQHSIDDISNALITYADYIEQNTTDKQVIPFKDFTFCNLIVNNIKNGLFTKEYFEGELLYQQEIYFEWLDNKFKAKLDIIQINHDNKTIRGVDIKTSKHRTGYFDLLEWRYDIQATVYQAALEVFRDKYYKDYTLEPFTFVVESTTSPGVPLAYYIEQPIYTNTITGFTHRGRKYKGILEIIELINWHDANGWDCEKWIYEQGGRIPYQIEE